MAVRYITVTTRKLSCPRCNNDLGSAEHRPGGNPYGVSEPYWTCLRCNVPLIVPAHLPARCDEWEMKREPNAETITTSLLNAPLESTSLPFLAAGCGGCLTVVAVFGVAIALGTMAVFENKPLVQGAIFGGLAAAAVLGGLVMMWDRRRGRRERAVEIGNLVARIEQSRTRMADPAYRQKLAGLGLTVRGPEAAAEPPEVAATLERLKAKARELRSERAANAT